MMIRITSPHFCAGIADGRSAPILAYMKGWTVRRIKAYCAAHREDVITLLKEQLAYFQGMPSIQASG